MFNWVCPDCGRTVDLAEKECPDCRARQPDAAETEDAATDPLPTERPRPADRSQPADQSPQPAAFAIRPQHLWIFALAVLVAVGGALYLARPELFQLDRLASLLPNNRPEPPPAPPGPVEVVGIRVWIDEDDGPRARSLLVNHAAIPQRGIEAEVRLTSADPELPPGENALGEFRITFEDELGPLSSAEVDTPLQLEDGVAILPPRHWIQFEVDFRR